jgi:capsular polysaccharide biosynthesis protein
VSGAHEPSAAAEPRRRWLPQAGRPRAVVYAFAVLAFVALAGAGAAVTRNNTLSYRSQTVLTINQPLLVASSRDAGPINKLSELRLQYSELLTTQVLATPIAQQVGISPGQAAQEVTAVNTPDSLLIVVTATTPTKARSTALASAAADQLVSYAQSSQAEFGVPTAQRVVLTVVTPAGTAARVSRGTRTVITVALFLGVVGAAAVFAIAAIVRRRRW